MANAGELRAGQDADNAAKRFAVATMHRGWTAAFEIWRSGAAETLRMEAVMKGFVNRVLNSKVSTAFETWQENAAEMIRMDTVMKGFCARVLNSKISRAFETSQGSSKNCFVCHQIIKPPREVGLALLLGVGAEKIVRQKSSIDC